MDNIDALPTRKERMRPRAMRRIAAAASQKYAPEGISAGISRTTESDAVLAAADVIERITISPKPSIPSGMTAWHGGDQPVPDDEIVDAFRRDGAVFTKEARHLDWLHSGKMSDILAYASSSPGPSASVPSISDAARIGRLRRVLHRYGDRVSMAMCHRPDWQQEIDEALGWVAENPEEQALNEDCQE